MLRELLGKEAAGSNRFSARASSKVRCPCKGEVMDDLTKPGVPSKGIVERAKAIVMSPRANGR